MERPSMIIFEGLYDGSNNKTVRSSPLPPLIVTPGESMIGFGAGVAQREHLVVNNRKVVIAHEYGIRGEFPFVAVRQIAIAVFVGIAVT
jgi:hypothetical protein